MNQNVTIVQIAKESGVSIATVSRVLNGTVPVSAQTREKVEAVIQKYQYSSNSIAQRIAPKTFHTIAIILPDIRNRYYSTLYLQIKAFLEDKGYFVMMYNSISISSYEFPAEKEADYVRELLSTFVDAVIILGGQCSLPKQSELYLRSLKELAEKIPVLVVSSPLPGIPATFYSLETETGLILALNYLVSRGHTRIGFAGGNALTETTRKRVQVFQSLAEELGYDYEPDLVATSDFSLEGGYISATKLLHLKKPVTAIVAISDTCAMGVIRACADYSKSVPQDISIVSCFQTLGDDYLTPRLTSVDCHLKEHGINISRTILALIQNKPIPELISTYPKLIIRESSGTPSAK